MKKLEERKDVFFVGEVATQTERVVVRGEGDGQERFDVLGLLVEVANSLEEIKRDLKEVLGK